MTVTRSEQISIAGRPIGGGAPCFVIAARSAGSTSSGRCVVNTATFRMSASATIGLPPESQARTGAYAL